MTLLFLILAVVIALTVLGMATHQRRRPCPTCGRTDTGGRLCNPCRTAQGMPFDRTVEP